MRTPTVGALSGTLKHLTPRTTNRVVRGGEFQDPRDLVRGTGAHGVLRALVCEVVTELPRDLASDFLKINGGCPTSSASIARLVYQSIDNARRLRTPWTCLPLKPRIVSLHSYGACTEVLDEIERAGVQGAVLHWWLGDHVLTKRALALGCWFSVNAAQVSKSKVLNDIPLDRVLTETDHPFGDRGAIAPRRPGHVLESERAIASVHKVSAERVRRHVWSNLDRLIKEVGCSALLPRSVRARLAALT